MIKPILFNTEMVQAILEGRKTVTRRIVKPQPTHEQPDSLKGSSMWWGNKMFLPPYQTGDVMWVRETWKILADLNACGLDRIKKIVGEPIEVKGKVHHGHIDEKRARDLHAEGKTDKEMAEELKVSRGAVALWRSRRGFEANKKEESMIKETEPTEQDKPTETEMFFADVEPEETHELDADCCPKCGGTGIVRQTNAARGIDIFTCPTCRGAGKKNTEDDFQEPTPKERCIAAGLNVVDVEPRTFLTSFFNNLMTGPDVERPTLETREQWEARRKDAIKTAMIDALGKGGALPAEWVIEWNERCEG